MPYIVHMEQYVRVTREEAMQARDGTIKLHGAEGFDGMRKAGRLAAEILDALVPHVVPGVSTEELDDIVREMTMSFATAFRRIRN